MLRNFNYEVPKSEDCVLINVNDWKCTTEITLQRINGKTSVTYVSTALKVHVKSEHFKDCPVAEGDTIFLSKVASEVAPLRSFPLEDNECYFNVPIMQIVGIFQRGEITLSNLHLLYDKVLLRKINLKGSLLDLPETSDMIGEVVKVGTHGFDKDWNSEPLKVKEKDIVLVKDNVATPIRLDDQVFYAVEERAIVGIFDSTLKVENIKFINESILMEQYFSRKVLNSTLLEAPDINYEDLDYSDVYNRDLFKVIYADKSLQNIKSGDILLAKRDYTDYVYLNNKKFFLLCGAKWVEAKVKE